jgi:RNA polymerase sigma factor (TIGR02999 family)
VTDQVQTTISRLLERAGNSEREAIGALVGILYEELRGLAHRQRLRWRGDDTLGTTALVHEAYLKLVKQERITTQSRAHFLALASMAMRHILSNYAEQRRTRKRGGGLERVVVSELDAPGAEQAAVAEAEDILAGMDGALCRLETTHARSCRVVECRFYGGMTVEETATALGVSPRTVKREWAFAQAWLKRELKAAI